MKLQNNHGNVSHISVPRWRPGLQMFLKLKPCTFSLEFHLGSLPLPCKNDFKTRSQFHKWHRADFEDFEKFYKQQKKILKGFSRKKSETIQNVCFKLFKAWSSTYNRQTHDCKRNLSPMILAGNQVVYS